MEYIRHFQEKPDCDGCRRMYELKMINGTATDYKDCSMCDFYLSAPDLLDENKDSIRIWSIVQGQRIVAGMTGVTIDVNHIPLWRAIDEYEIEDRLGCFEKVLNIAKLVFQIEADKAKEQQSNSR